MESGAQICVGSGNSPVVLERVESAAKKVPLSPKVIQGTGGGVPEASSILAVWVLDSSPPSRGWHSAHVLCRSLLVPQACPVWVKPLYADTMQAFGLSSFFWIPSPLTW